MSEHDEQVAVIDWFRHIYPKYRLIAIPNGQWIAGTGKRKYALINKYKAEGLTNGVYDLFLCHSDGQHHGLWVEMKDKGKTEKALSEDQKNWASDMILEGYLPKCACGFEQARDIIIDYMNGYYKTFKGI